MSATSTDAIAGAEDTTAETPSELVTAEAAPALPVRDPALEPLREHLRRIERPTHLGLRALLFAVSFAAFYWSMRDVGPVALVVLIGVLVFHELGHFVAMKAFGYADLKVFFVPFFGAAVSGRAQQPDGWRAGIVSLAGPVPGLLLGAALVPWSTHHAVPWASTLAAMLVYVNGFNLLPVLPLDGGRVLGAVLYSRSAVLEILATIAGGIALTVSFGSGANLIIPGLVAGVLINRIRTIGALKPLRAVELEWSGLTSDLPDDSLGALQAAANTLLEKNAFATEKSHAATVASLHESVQLRPTGLRDSLVLFGAWALAVIIGFATVQDIRHPSASWREYSSPLGWRAQFPSEPVEFAVPGAAEQSVVTDGRAASLAGSRIFIVVALDFGPAKDFTQRSVDRGALLHELAESSATKVHGTIASQQMTTLAGLPAIDSIIRLQDGSNLEYLHAIRRQQFLMVGLQGAIDPGERAHFVNSFAFDGD